MTPARPFVAFFTLFQYCIPCFAIFIYDTSFKPGMNSGQKAVMIAFSQRKSQSELASRESKGLVYRVSQSCTAFAHKALIIGRRRYKRPSKCALNLYYKCRAWRRNVLEKQCQCFFSCYVVVMVCGLEAASIGQNSCEILDTSHEDSGKVLLESCACIYEEDFEQICSDVYEYQQVQAAEDSVSQPDIEVVPDEGDVNGPQDEMLIGAHGLSHDPTADCEGDDFQDTVPTFDDTSRVGVRGNTSLLPIDVFELLKFQRSGIGVRPLQQVSSAQRKDFPDVFDFVPDLVLALLMSLYPDEVQLYRILSQGWLRTWKGWQEWDKSKRHEGSKDLNDDSFAEELVRRIITIPMDQAVTNYPSDDMRRRELLSSGLEV